VRRFINLASPIGGGSGYSPVPATLAAVYAGPTTFMEMQRAGKVFGQITATGGTGPYVAHVRSNSFYGVNPTDVDGLFDLQIDGPTSAGSDTIVVRVTDALGAIFDLSIPVTLTAFDEKQMEGLLLDIDPHAVWGVSAQASISSITDGASGYVLQKQGANALQYKPNAVTGGDGTARGSLVFTGGSSGPYLELTAGAILNYFATPGSGIGTGHQVPRAYFAVIKNTGTGSIDLLCFGTASKLMEMLFTSAGQWKWNKQSDTGTTVAVASTGGNLGSNEVCATTWFYSGQRYAKFWKDGMNGPAGGESSTPYGDGSWWQNAGEDMGCATFSGASNGQATPTALRIGLRTTGTTATVFELLRIGMLNRQPDGIEREALGKRLVQLYGTAAYPSVPRFDTAGYEIKGVEDFDINPVGNWAEPNSGAGNTDLEPTQFPATAAGNGLLEGAGNAPWIMDPRYSFAAPYESQLFGWRPGVLIQKVDFTPVALQSHIGMETDNSQSPYPTNDPAALPHGSHYTYMSGSVSARNAPNMTQQFPTSGTRFQLPFVGKAGAYAAMGWGTGQSGLWPTDGENDPPEVLSYEEANLHFTSHSDDSETGNDSAKPEVIYVGGFTGQQQGYRTVWSKIMRSRIEYYVDNCLVGWNPITSSMASAMFPMATVGVGTSSLWGGKGAMTDPSILPLAISLDYIKVMRPVLPDIAAISVTQQSEVTAWANANYGSRAAAPAAEVAALDRYISKMKAVTTLDRFYNDNASDRSLWDRRNRISFPGLAHAGHKNAGLWDFKTGTLMAEVGTLAVNDGVSLAGNGTDAAINTGYDIGTQDVLATGNGAITNFSGTLPAGNCAQNRIGSATSFSGALAGSHVKGDVRGMNVFSAGPGTLATDDGNGHLVSGTLAIAIASGGSGYTSNPALVYTPRAGVTVLKNPGGAVITRVGNVITGITYSSPLIADGIVDVTCTGGGGTGFAATMTPPVGGTIVYATGAWTLNYATAPANGQQIVANTYRYGGPTIRDLALTVALTALPTNGKHVVGSGDFGIKLDGNAGSGVTYSLTNFTSGTLTVKKRGNMNAANLPGLYTGARARAAVETYCGGEMVYSGYQNSYLSGAPAGDIADYTPGKPFYILGKNGASPEFSDGACWYWDIGATPFMEEQRIQAALLTEFKNAVNPSWLI